MKFVRVKDNGRPKLEDTLQLVTSKYVTSVTNMAVFAVVTAKFVKSMLRKMKELADGP